MTGPPDGSPPSRHERVKALFLAALDVPRGRRAAFLAEACAGDDTLRREVLELFLLHGEQDSVLDAPLDPDAALHELGSRVAGRIGSYRLLRELGRGGMGVVYLAEHAERPGQLVALKLLAAGAISPEARERFRLEAEVLRRLDHPGIARILESGAWMGPVGISQPWIVMDYVEGRPLHEHAAAAGLGIEARVALLIDVCTAVQHVHAQGIVHRDLKPSNILVRSDGRPVVLDFGVARLTRGDQRPVELATRTGQLVGTPQYMSPEQVQAEPAGMGPASDVYSLGVITYELLAGHPPYDASSVSLHRAVVSILTRDVPPLGKASPALRGPLERIVAMALEKDPAQRYPDAGSFGDDLRRHLSGRTVRAPGPGIMRRLQRWSRTRRRLVGAMILAVMAGLLIAAWWLGRDRAMPREQVRAAYREAETLMIQSVPLLYEGERTPARVQQVVDRLVRARNLLDQVPPLRHRNLLVRRLEKDLGTAQFLLGELTWDTSPYRAAVVTLEHALSVPQDTLPGWAADRQVPELGPLYTPQPEILSLLAAAELGLYRLWGEGSTLDQAGLDARQTLMEYMRILGRPRPPDDRSGDEPIGDRYVYCYNSLTEITTEQARYHWDPTRARQAVLYSDSAYARRVSVQRNWAALGSLLFERGRAFHALGELTHSRAALDSAWIYLRACSDFRGANRAWVFAQTREEFAQLGLERARLESDFRARAALLARARHDVDTAMVMLTPADVPRAALASLRSLEGELLIELAELAGARRSVPLLDSAEVRLREASEELPTSALPRFAAGVWVRKALLARSRCELTGDQAGFDTALEALDRASTLSGARSDSLLLVRIRRERDELERLRAAAAGQPAKRLRAHE